MNNIDKIAKFFEEREGKEFIELGYNQGKRLIDFSFKLDKINRKRETRIKLILNNNEPQGFVESNIKEQNSGDYLLKIELINGLILRIFKK